MDYSAGDVGLKKLPSLRTKCGNPVMTAAIWKAHASQLFRNLYFYIVAAELIIHPVQNWPYIVGLVLLDNDIQHIVYRPAAKGIYSIIAQTNIFFLII